MMPLATRILFGPAGRDSAEALVVGAQTEGAQGMAPYRRHGPLHAGVADGSTSSYLARMRIVIAPPGRELEGLMKVVASPPLARHAGQEPPEDWGR